MGEHFRGSDARFVRLQNVRQALQSINHTRAMQRGNDEMPRLGRAQSNRRRFRIANFTHHDHIGTLAQSCSQSYRKVLGIAPHLPLRKKTLLVVK